MNKEDVSPDIEDQRRSRSGLVGSPFGGKFITETSAQLRTALPTLACMVLNRLPWLISLRFVGDIGSNELAAAALASTLCNVTGLSFSVGMSSAITTLTGQARGDLMARVNSRQTGEKNTKIDSFDSETTSLLGNATEESESQGTPLPPMVFLFRGMFTQMMFVIPIGFLWIYGVKDILLVLGQGEHLSLMTQDYLRILTPGLWSFSINWTLTAWLQSIEMADVPAWTSAFGLFIHVPCNLLYIYKFGWGYLGVAAGTVTYQLIQPVLALAYLFGTTHGRNRILKNTFASGVGRSSLSFWPEANLAVKDGRGIRAYLSLAIPGIVSISEWWASEVAIFLSGLLKPNPVLALGGMTIYQSLNAFCFMFSIAFSVAGSTRVSNLLGAGQAQSASYSAKVAVGFTVIVSGSLGCLLLLLPHTLFPSMFAPNEIDLVNEASLTLPLLSLYVLADGIQNTFNGILKGCGRQVWAMPVVVLAYWMIGLPVGYYLSFIRYGGQMYSGTLSGIVGLVAGMTIGTCLHMFLFAILVANTDWKGESRRARERIRNDG